MPVVPDSSSAAGCRWHLGAVVVLVGDSLRDAAGRCGAGGVQVPGSPFPGLLVAPRAMFSGHPGAGFRPVSVSRSSFAGLIEPGRRGVAPSPSGLVAPSRTGQGLRPTGRATGGVRDRSNSAGLPPSALGLARFVPDPPSPASI